ncbi:hypothetical protein CB0940_10042 [Cercospora beticola]|uniref:Uncharacterized protein n=1 Tax=Cercospora beticola TaxID=122368 RepID=A0A2G5HTS7_CERBT|nr:hypothetical protein CB0940_10042 [Cercospora beticola]PIA95941.1 hypothetical protein CB0940_10042 [Cercospora beticola]WPB06738.1 hypothetical protein RHO25_011398 [Cercospora beticola]
MAQASPAEAASFTDNDAGNLKENQTPTRDATTSHEPQKALLRALPAQAQDLAPCGNPRPEKAIREPQSSVSQSCTDRLERGPPFTKQEVEELHSRVLEEADRANQNMQETLAKDEEWYATDEAEFRQQRAEIKQLVVVLEKEQGRLEERLAV